MGKQVFVTGLDRMIEEKLGDQAITTLVEIRAKNLNDLLSLVGDKQGFVKLFVCDAVLSEDRGKTTVDVAKSCGDTRFSAYILVMAVSGDMVIWTGLPTVIEHGSYGSEYVPSEYANYKNYSPFGGEGSQMSKDKKMLFGLGFVEVGRVIWRA